MGLDKKTRKNIKKLKEIFTKELVLAALDLDKKIRIEVNILDYVMEGVLSIECENRWWKSIVYLS